MSGSLFTLARAALVLAAAMLAGCVATPQTREAYKTVAKEHTNYYLAESYVANRRFEDVVVMFGRKWQECFSFSKTMTQTDRNGLKTQWTDTYQPHSRKVGNSLVEMTIQMTTTLPMLNQIPPGGLYQAALDIQRLPGDKTKLTWYSPEGWKDTWERNKQWSEGKNVACRPAD